MKFFTILSLLAAIGNAQPASRAVQNFFCNDKLNELIRKHFDASQMYLSLSNHYAHDRLALYGFSKMFEHNWKEAVSSGEQLMDYVTKRGGQVQTPMLSRPAKDTKWHDQTVCEVIEEILELEKSLNSALLSVYQCGGGANYNNEDPQLQYFIASEYLSKQVDSIRDIAVLLTRLERVTGAKCDASLGIHTIDKELLQNYEKINI